MVSLYMSYDNSGFSQALKDSEGSEAYPITAIGDMIEHAAHDLKKGFCESFQIYMDNGELLHDSSELKRSFQRIWGMNSDARQMRDFLKLVIEESNWMLTGTEGTPLYTKIKLKIDLCKR